jgi:hypothetical protein
VRGFAREKCQCQVVVSWQFSAGRSGMQTISYPP